jgi:predicted XRE-type DNA-binding protein
LGVAAPDPIPALKEELRREIVAFFGHFDQFLAARILGVDQPRFSDLQRGRRMERLSLQKLVRMLARIDRHVQLTVVNVGHKRPQQYLGKGRRETH